MTEGSTGRALEARGISKSFGGISALDGVDFDLIQGEVHALLGENGAGKTTLSNVLAGLYRADAGEVLVDGSPREFRTPSQAIAAGIGMVHQHFRLVEPMTVAENLHLGWEDTPKVCTRRALAARARASSGAAKSRMLRKYKRDQIWKHVKTYADYLRCGN